MIAFQVTPAVNVYELWFSPNCQVLAARTREEVALHEASSGVCFHSSAPRGPFCGYWGGIDGQQLHLHRPGTGLVPIGEAMQTAHSIKGSLDLANAIFSQGGSRAVRQNRTEQGVSLVGYDIGAGGARESRAWQLHLLSDGAVPAPVEFLSDGERFLVWVYSRTQPNRLQLWGWNESAVQIERVFPSGLYPVTALSLGGRWFARGYARSMNLWVCDITDFSRPLQEVKAPMKRQITAAAFHPTGRYLAITHKDSVSFYDTATWKVAKTFDWKVGKLRCVAFSPDGALAAVGSDKGKVVVWDVDV